MPAEESKFAIGALTIPTISSQELYKATFSQIVFLEPSTFFVDVDGLIYVTDRIRGGLYILEYTGPAVN